MRRPSLFLLLGAVLTAFGIQNASGTTAAEDPVQVYLDGHIVSFDKQPVIDDGTTLVQVRPFFEKMGLTVEWNENTETVTGSKNGYRVSLVIGESTAYVNGQATALEAAPRLVGDSTFVPLKFVAEAFGAKVRWYDGPRAVGIFVDEKWTNLLY